MLEIFLFILVLVLALWVAALQLRYNQFSASTDSELLEYVKVLAELQEDVRQKGADVKLLLGASMEHSNQIADLGSRIETLEKTPAQFESKYSENTKKECIDYYFKNSDTLSIRQAASDCHIPYSTMKMWVRKAQ